MLRRESLICIFCGDKKTSNMSNCSLNQFESNQSNQKHKSKWRIGCSEPCQITFHCPFIFDLKCMVHGFPHVKTRPSMGQIMELDQLFHQVNRTIVLEHPHWFQASVTCRLQGCGFWVFLVCSIKCSLAVIECDRQNRQILLFWPVHEPRLALA